jgi:hypothetical protein
LFDPFKDFLVGQPVEGGYAAVAASLRTLDLAVGLIR